MTLRRSRRRAGYTLLEVLLASVIAVILLAALYVTLDITLTRLDVGRDAAARNDLSRAVVNRMGSDLTGVLGPLQPTSGGPASSSGQSSGGGSSPSSGSGSSPSGSGTGGSSTQQSGSGGGAMSAGSTPSGSGTGGATTAAAGGAAGTATGSDGTTVDASGQAVNLPFHGGVIGTDKQLTVFTSKVPESATNPDALANPGSLYPADLRRVTYYLGPTGSGLCRQERPWVTADGVGNSADPDTSTEATDVIAPEVQDVTFEYFDGSDWQTSWDGTQLGADGVNLMGPPRAIRVTFTLQSTGRGGQTVERQVQHVFPVRAAVGTFVPTSDGAGTNAAIGTSTGGM